jgi:16S rRNA G1207 methylase RsmC
MNTPDHYFSSAPQSDSRRSEFTIESVRGTLTLFAESGVFSQHGLDKGTAVLLDTMRKLPASPLPAGSLLCDLGCGSGAIALTLATMYPQCTVYAVDINERARELCEENAKRNSCSNVIVASPESIDSAISFATLWSNPPIRIGKQALHDLLATWLSKLKPDGTAHLVVSKNLGADSLSQWIQSISFSCEKVASSKGFRVLAVEPTA